MIGLTIEAKDDMLAIFAGKVFSIALYQGDEEVSDALYSRHEAQFGPVVGTGETRYVHNIDIVRFEGFNATHLIDHWAVFDPSGLMRARYRVTGEPLEVSPAMDCKFRPGELRIGLP